MIDRSTLTPLEIAVWAASYTSFVGTLNRHHEAKQQDALKHADEGIEVLRLVIGREAHERKQSEANARHAIAYRMVNGQPVSIIGCSCGYRPERHDYDPEELIALHLAYVNADPTAVRELVKEEEKPNANQ